MGQVDKRLSELGIELPEPAESAANYCPYTISGNLVYISGQLPIKNGIIQHVGKLGRDYNIERGQEAAKLCALNLVAQLKQACKGDLERVKACIRLGGFVNSTDEFVDQPQVINGASDIIGDIFGPKGQHARAAVGVNSLPLGVAVEIEGIFELKGIE